MEAVNLLDGSYGVCPGVARNQLRTKRTSFDSIKSRWNKFRLSLLQNKLDNLKNTMVGDLYRADSGVITKRDVRKIEKRSTAIARVEEKIRILNKEDVPSKYVENRAIKLRDNMMKNLVYHSGTAYAVPEEKYDDVFAEPAVSYPNDITSEVMASNSEDSPQIDVSSVAKNVEGEIAENVNEAMNNNDTIVSSEGFAPVSSDMEAVAENDETSVIPVAEEESSIPEITMVSPDEVAKAVGEGHELDDEVVGPEEIKDAVDEKIDGIVLDSPIINADPSEKVVTSDEIKDAIDEKISDVGLEAPVANDNSGDTVEEDDSIDLEEIRQALEEKLNAIMLEDPNKSGDSDEISVGEEDNIAEEEVKPMFELTDLSDAAEDNKVAEEAPVTENKAYSNMMLKRYGIAPMTHEEIKDSQDKIGEYKPPVVETDEAIRVIPIVVPDRENVSESVKEDDIVEEYTFDDTADDHKSTELHMDYSDATPRDVVMAVGAETSIGGLEAIKARALELRRQHEDSKHSLKDATSKDAEVAQELSEEQESFANAQREHDAKVAKLTDYCEALEEDMRRNKEEEDRVRRETELKRSEIERMRKEAAKLGDEDAMIDEIISPEATNVRGMKR